MNVLDASVIYKWYATEEGSGKALEILKREGDEIVVPDLALYEIANILWSNSAHTKEDIARTLDHLDSLGIEIIVANIPLLKEAAQIARQYQVTVYDAAYAALAKSLGCDFITADKKLCRKLSSLNFVRPL